MYLAEVGRKRRAREENLSVDKLTCNPAKRGHPLLLGERTDETVKQYLLKVRECRGIVNTAITTAGSKGIILNIDKTRLSEYGGHSTSQELGPSLF